MTPVEGSADGVRLFDHVLESMAVLCTRHVAEPVYRYVPDLAEISSCALPRDSGSSGGRISRLSPTRSGLMFTVDCNPKIWGSLRPLFTLRPLRVSFTVLAY